MHIYHRFTLEAVLDTVICVDFVDANVPRVAAFRYSQKMACGTYYSSIFLEGMVYFAIVAGAMFSLFVWAWAPDTLIGLSQPFLLCIVTVAGSRLTLNLRRLVAKNEQRITLDSKLSQGPSFDFAVHNRGDRSMLDINSRP
ncbi:hypothetical protein C0991_004497 [Blastosporella zonata]|nr:hypothetical protein C0991_004497 [Blastosporella zonata]